MHHYKGIQCVFYTLHISVGTGHIGPEASVLDSMGLRGSGKIRASRAPGMPSPQLPPSRSSPPFSSSVPPLRTVSCVTLWITVDKKEISQALRRQIRGGNSTSDRSPESYQFTSVSLSRQDPHPLSACWPAELPSPAPGEEASPSLLLEVYWGVQRASP